MIRQEVFQMSDNQSPLEKSRGVILSHWRRVSEKVVFNSHGVKRAACGLRVALEETSERGRGRGRGGGRGRYLLAGWWEFIGLSCQVGQILQNSLQVSHFTQHVDLMVLHTHTHTHTHNNDQCFYRSPTVCTGGSISHTHTHTHTHWPGQASAWWRSCSSALSLQSALCTRLASPCPPGRRNARWRPAARCPADRGPRPSLQRHTHTHTHTGAGDEEPSSENIIWFLFTLNITDRSQNHKPEI